MGKRTPKGVPRYCDVDGCGRRHVAHGFCDLHRQRWERTGTTDPPVWVKSVCEIEGCTEFVESFGMCYDHHDRRKRYGDPLAERRKDRWAALRALGCSVDECGNEYYLKGYCEHHYTKFYALPARRAKRDAARALLPPPPTIPERVLALLDRDGPMPRWRLDIGNCWSYSGTLQASGYGRIGTNKSKQLVHRVAFEALVRPLAGPEETLDHLCANPACCRATSGPDTHLEPVTQRVTTERRHVCARCAFFARCPLCSLDLHGYGVEVPSITYERWEMDKSGDRDQAFRSLIDRAGPFSELLRSPCHEWMGPRNAFGYGVFTLNGIKEPAHRRAVGLGKFDEANPLVPDHRCRRRACVNPFHLEIVDRDENSRRGLKKSWCHRCLALRACPGCGFRIEGVASAVEAMELVGRPLP